MIDFFGRRFRAWSGRDAGYSGDVARNVRDWTDKLGDATLVTSQTREPGWGGYKHAPVIDLDGAHCYVASTTNGHGHLYLNNLMSFEAMMEILDVLAKHGVIEKGYAEASRARGYSAVRTPWTRKV